MNQKLIFTNLVGEAIDDLVASLDNPPVFVILDVNTAQYVLPVLREQSQAVANATTIEVKAGDMNKNVEGLQNVWSRLSAAGATRNSVIINVGGGVVTDLGGFAAATFKRGLRTINVPTTLLGAVDASVGGKTGINFNGYKNQIGTFTEPMASVISTGFFVTLPEQQLLSGYAEMLKHALLESRQMLGDLLNYSVVYPIFDPDRLLALLEENVQVKARIVDADFTEQGLRKALNLGHTAGHAMESLAMERKAPIPHGYAVAWGLVVALILSNLKLGFSGETLHQFAAYVKKNYLAYDIKCEDYPRLIEFMQQDKKNTGAGKINFTLLKDVGQPVTDVEVTPDEIKAAFDIYRDLLE